MSRYSSASYYRSSVRSTSSRAVRDPVCPPVRFSQKAKIVRHLDLYTRRPLRCQSPRILLMVSSMDPPISSVTHGLSEQQMGQATKLSQVTRTSCGVSFGGRCLAWS